MKKIFKFTFFLIIFSSGCQRSAPNLDKVLGVGTHAGCRVIDSTNKSTMNDTVLAWMLEHNSADIISLLSSLAFHKSDQEDLIYASQSALEYFPLAKPDFVEVYRAKKQDFDFYWVISKSGTSSVLIAYQY